MKTLFLTCMCALGIGLSVLAQSPSVSPQGTPDNSAAASAVSPSATISPADASDVHSSIEKKLRKHMRFTVDNHDVDFDGGVDGDLDSFMAIPIVAIIFTTLFGAPVLIVGTIMLLSYMKARSLHRTVRDMVAKGQPVPPELLVGPAAAPRVRSDMRRGIILVTVGAGIMMFFGALSNFETDGPWAIGLIPFFIGVGYLLVWKLEGKKDNATPVE